MCKGRYFSVCPLGMGIWMILFGWGGRGASDLVKLDSILCQLLQDVLKKKVTKINQYSTHVLLCPSRVMMLDKNVCVEGFTKTQNYSVCSDCKSCSKRHCRIWCVPIFPTWQNVPSELSPMWVEWDLVWKIKRCHEYNRSIFWSIPERKKIIGTILKRCNIWITVCVFMFSCPTSCHPTH